MVGRGKQLLMFGGAVSNAGHALIIEARVVSRTFPE